MRAPGRTETRPADNAESLACAHTIHRRKAPERGKSRTKDFFFQRSMPHTRHLMDERQKQQRPGRYAIGSSSPCKAKRKTGPRSGREETNSLRDARRDSNETAGRRSCAKST